MLYCDELYKECNNPTKYGIWVSGVEKTVRFMPCILWTFEFCLNLYWLVLLLKKLAVAKLHCPCVLFIAVIWFDNIGPYFSLLPYQCVYCITFYDIPLGFFLLNPPLVLCLNNLLPWLFLVLLHCDAMFMLFEVIV